MAEQNYPDQRKSAVKDAFQMKRETEQRRKQSDDKNLAYASTALTEEGPERDLTQERTQSTVDGDTYGTNFAASGQKGGRVDREQSVRSTNMGGQKIQQVGTDEDILMGRGAITVDGKSLKPGSKAYLRALDALSRAETLEVEADVGTRAR